MSPTAPSRCAPRDRDQAAASGRAVAGVAGAPPVLADPVLPLVTDLEVRCVGDSAVRARPPVGRRQYLMALRSMLAKDWTLEVQSPTTPDDVGSGEGAHEVRRVQRRQHRGRRRFRLGRLGPVGRHPAHVVDRGRRQARGHRYHQHPGPRSGVDPQGRAPIAALLTAGAPAWLVDALGDAGPTLVVPIVLGAVYALLRWAEPRLPAPIARVLLGSTRPPTYTPPSSTPDEPDGRHRAA
ncbi:hypothetical protein SAMN05421805_1011507 [Saccharopolyspora antimicrobica]|uniref:Uncharacterized protein n=1 Tax=Saccharopolyspora antimicrobica TaxID=455193 RepID=A0A1I4TP12_9PSEU|nr:hypothetical protein ATL45_6921 [Saccharopolyspora antimicrobica]SFM78320.1 hypothetical protein SAMN05421805_1011507 [Saccharopolyspora antimicrobica]